jgi:hypothetical protein
MIKVLVIGLWICAITLASSYTAASWKLEQVAQGRKDYLDGLNYEKTAPISVPILQNGELQGYVVAQFVFTADSRVLSKLSVPPHAFVVDEAFRLIYSDPATDFTHLEKVDLAALSKKVVENVNAHLQSDLIVDVLVEQFTYYSKETYLNQQPA